MRYGFAALVAALMVAPMAVVPMRAEAQPTPVLQNMQTQLLPNGHVRVLMQFLGAVTPRPNSAIPTSAFAVQFDGAAASATVPNVIPVNLGAVSTITVGQFGRTLTVSLSLVVPLRPAVQSLGNGLIVVDVPPAPGGMRAGPVSSSPNGAYGASGGYGSLPQANFGSGVQMYHIVRLHYADVSEVVGILSNSGNVAPSAEFNPQPSQLGTQPINYGGFGSYGSSGLPTATQPLQLTPYGESGAQSMGQRVNDNIAIDRRLNAIVLSGSPQQIAQMEGLIRQLDVPVRSVLLDTSVIEVTENGAKALGLDYNQTPTTPITRVFNSQSQAINGLPSTAVPGALEFQTNLFLLVSKGGAHILANPKILTEDGVTASILTGDSLPIRVNTPVGVGGVGTIASQVEYINVGVNLQILPRITGDHTVEANVFSEVSSVSGFTANNDPQISTRQAQTRVNLVEGQTLVIGGLMQQRDIHNLQKIPLLGDLPLVGALFRFYTETRQNTNLIITITPHIEPAPGEVGTGPVLPAPAPTMPGGSY